MINRSMKDYTYFQILTDTDEYGQETISETSTDTIKMAIYLNTQTITDNILYKDADYLGLTYEKSIDDTYIIQYDDSIKLKVLHTNPFGRLNQVFMKKIV